MKLLSRICKNFYNSKVKNVFFLNNKKNQICEWTNYDYFNNKVWGERSKSLEFLYVTGVQLLPA